MPGLAIAMLKFGAWATLLFGVGIALSISLFAPTASGSASHPWYAFPEYLRIVLELGCAFFGFTGWSLLLVVALIAEQMVNDGGGTRRPSA